MAAAALAPSIPRLLQEVLYDIGSAAVLICPLSLAFCHTASNATSPNANDEEARRQVLATDDQRMEALRQRNAAPLREICMDDYSLDFRIAVIRPQSAWVRRHLRG